MRYISSLIFVAMAMGTVQASPSSYLLQEILDTNSDFKAADCGGILQGPGSIESPNYPDPYPPGVICTWDVVVPSSDDDERTIHLNLDSFDLGTPCTDGGDFIEIQAGPLVQQICGTSLTSHSMATNSRIVTIVFVSQSNGIQGSGFSMDVSFDEVITPGNNTCDAGYVYLEKQQACVDVDECSLGPLTCDANASCKNTPGLYTCQCNPGYVGDGSTCTQIKECQEGWVTFPGSSSCYYFSTLSSLPTYARTWQSAGEYCKKDGAQLVCVDSREEYSYLTSHWNNYTGAVYSNGTWIGLQASSGTYTFTCQDGSFGMQPKPWLILESYAEPGSYSTCAYISASLQWSTLPCDDVYPTVCQIVVEASNICPTTEWLDFPSANKKKCIKQLLKMPMSFDQAKAACSAEAPGATVLTVSTSQETANLLTSRSWLDLRKSTGSNQWVSSQGEVLEKDVYQNWIDPAGASQALYSEYDLCAVLVQSELEDQSCTSTSYQYPFICEKPLHLF